MLRLGMSRSWPQTTKLLICMTVYSDFVVYMIQANVAIRHESAMAADHEAADMYDSVQWLCADIHATTFCLYNSGQCCDFRLGMSQTWPQTMKLFICMTVYNDFVLICNNNVLLV